MTRLVRVALITIVGFALMIMIFLSMLVAGGASQAASPKVSAVATTVSTEAPVETTMPATVERSSRSAAPRWVMS